MSGSSAEYTLRSTRVVLPTGIRPADVHVRDGVITAVTCDETEAPAHGVAPASQASTTRPFRPPTSDLQPPTSDLRSQDLRPPTSDLHDLGHLVLMPGIVDTHVHVNEPGRTEWEGFETASAAAAAGGITTIVD